MLELRSLRYEHLEYRKERIENRRESQEPGI